jgi:methyl-accepting chemotaxis protein
MSIGLVAVGIVGLYFTQNANARISSMYQDELIPIKILGDAATQSEAMRANLLEYATMDSQSAKDEVKANIEDGKKCIKDDLTSFSKIPMDDYEIAFYKTSVGSFDMWLAIVDQFIKQVDSNNVQDALILYRINTSNYFDIFNSNINKLVDYSIKNAEQTNLATKAAEETQFRFMIIIVGIIVIICIYDIFI